MIFLLIVIYKVVCLLSTYQCPVGAYSTSYTSLQERLDRRRSGGTAVGAARLRSAHHHGRALLTHAAVAARHKDVRALLVHAHDALRFFQLALALLRCYLTKAGGNALVASEAWAITRKRLQTLA